jgi:hypothetical protein
LLAIEERRSALRVESTIIEGAIDHSMSEGEKREEDRLKAAA